LHEEHIGRIKSSFSDVKTLTLDMVVVEQLEGETNSSKKKQEHN